MGRNPCSAADALVGLSTPSSNTSQRVEGDPQQTKGLPHLFHWQRRREQLLRTLHFHPQLLSRSEIAAYRHRIVGAKHFENLRTRFLLARFLHVSQIEVSPAGLPGQKLE